MSAKIPPLNSKVVNRYSPPDPVKWVSWTEACQIIRGMHPRTLRRVINGESQFLKGKKFRVHRIREANRRAGEHALFLWREDLAQLERAASGDEWAGEYTDSTGTYLDYTRCKEQFEFGHLPLVAWSTEKCPALGNRLLRRRKILALIPTRGGGRGFRWVYVFHIDDLAEIQRAGPVDDGGLTTDEVSAKYGINKGTLRNYRIAKLVRAWMRWEPMVRGGLKPGIAWKGRRVYHPEDIDSLSKQSRNKTPSDGEWISISDAIKAPYGFNQRSLYNWMDPNKYCPLGRALRYREITTPRGKKRYQIWKADLEELRRIRLGLPEPLPGVVLAHVMSTDPTEGKRQAKETARETARAFAEAGQPITCAAIDYSKPTQPPEWLKPWYHSRKLVFEGRELELAPQAILRITILEALQATGWERSAPLDKEEIDADKLRGPVHDLNNAFRIKSIPIKLRSDGPALSVSWEPWDWTKNKKRSPTEL